ncbi:hypothetical protein M885DRAFT_510524 [Pelagophyceae sp. CCMP2097]|nr:hypothetical protein M885DRAFT_510524 [Pelagophyceae sp. CCMP2097]
MSAGRLRVGAPSEPGAAAEATSASLDATLAGLDAPSEPTALVTQAPSRFSDDLEVGTAVFCQWRRGRRWFPGVVTGISGSGAKRLYDVLYEDGVFEGQIKPQYTVDAESVHQAERETAKRQSEAAFSFAKDLLRKCFSIVADARWPNAGEYVVHLHNDTQTLDENCVVAFVAKASRRGAGAREFECRLVAPTQHRLVLRLGLMDYGIRWRLAAIDDVLAHLDDGDGVLGDGAAFEARRRGLADAVAAMLASRESRASATPRAASADVAAPRVFPGAVFDFVLLRATHCGLVAKLAKGGHVFGPGATVSRNALRCEVARLASLRARKRASADLGAPGAALAARAPPDALRVILGFI